MEGIQSVIAINAICHNKQQEFWREDKNKKKYIMKKSKGMVIRYAGNIYVITCFSCIEDFTEITCIIRDKNVALSVLKYDIPMDLAILECKDIIEKKVLLEIEYTMNDITKNIFEIITDSMEIKCEQPMYKHSLFVSHHISQMPFIYTKVQDYKFHDICGSILCSNKKVYGMVVQYDDINQMIKSIPAYYINRFIENIMNGVQLGNIYLETQICSISDDDEDKDTETDYKTGHYVKSAYNINYTLKDDNIKKFKFKKGDIIVRINNNKTDECGKIYDENIKIAVNADTYIAYHTGNNICISLLDATTGLVSEVNIYKKAYNDTLSFQLRQNKNILLYDGFILVEISEELYRYYLKQGKVSALLDYKYRTRAISDNYRPIIIINTQEEPNNKINIVSRLNGKYILNLNHVKELIEKDNNSKIITVSMTHTQSYNIICE